MSKHTPGPWKWVLSPSSYNVGLLGPRHAVMRFARWGMQGATPLFRDAEGVLGPAARFGAPTLGREHHGWDMLLDHPDARLIAAAPELLAALQGLLHEYDLVGTPSTVHPDGHTCSRCLVRRLLARLA